MRGLATLLLLAGMAWAQAPDSVAARLQKLEDKAAIERVLLDYGRYLDARDFRSYASLFAKEGEWIGGFGTVKGPAEIQAFMEKALGSTNRGNTYHLLSNFVIEVQGDTATAWSRWAFITPGPENRAVISQGGRYEDRLVRENGQWKFLRREAFTDVPAMQPQAAQPKAQPAK